MSRTSIRFGIVLVLLLGFGPLWWARGAEFSGTDERAMEAIRSAAPGYTPWVQPLFEPAGSEVETLLFSLQAGIGGGILGYVMGWYRGRGSARKENEETGDAGTTA